MVRDPRQGPGPGPASARSVNPNLGAWQEASGQDGSSVYDNPGFRSAPAFLRPLDGARVQDCTRAKLFLRDGTGGFLVGERVEVAFDGKLRKITAADGKSITIDPPLDVAPETTITVANWREQAEVKLDLRLGEKSPGLKLEEGRKPIGSQIDVQAYLRGEFDGDGKRDVPQMPRAPDAKPATRPAGE